MVICTSPQLIAAYHVLLRLREPRHPPSALLLLLLKFYCSLTQANLTARYAIPYTCFFFLIIVQNVKDLRARTKKTGTPSVAVTTARPTARTTTA